MPLDPTELIQAMNYLGHNVTVPMTSTQGLQGSAAGGALPAPAQGAPTATGGGMGVQIGGGGGQQVGLPTGAASDAIQQVLKNINVGGSDDLGVRGDTGGTSLSDYLRSSGTGTFGGGGTPPPTFTQGNFPLVNFDDAFGIPTTASGDLGFGGISGFGEGGAATAPALEGAAEGAATGAGGGSLTGGAVFGGISAIPSIWEGINTYFKDRARQQSVQQGIRGDISLAQQVLPQIVGSAVDPGAIQGMSESDKANLFYRALQGQQSASGLASPRATSGQMEAGVRHPDFTQVGQALDQFGPLSAFDLVAAYDAIGGKNPWGLSYSFPEALHSLQGAANLPVSQGYNPTAPWDPNYANQRLIQETTPRQEGSTLFQDQTMRAAGSPQEFLSTLGFDPALADKIGPLMQNVPPGQYLDRLNQIFGAINPDVGASPFGQMLASLGVPATEATPQPVPQGTSSAGLVAAAQGGDVAGIGPSGGGEDLDLLKQQLGTP